MDAYILGAGASKSYNKSKTGIRMPLAKNFFKTYNSLKISGDLNVVVTQVFSYLKEYREIDTFINDTTYEYKNSLQNPCREFL